MMSATICQKLGALLLLSVVFACTDAHKTPTLRKPVEERLMDGSYRAGLARGVILSPAGLSAGGYGLRPGPMGRFNGRLGAMRGSYGTLWIKALALENGGAALLWVKIPMVFPSDVLRRKVLARLGELSGLDFADALILTATHTHSGPARFWALPPGFIGLLGVDNFDPAVLAALADDIARTALAAWKNRQPARIGITEILRFDPQNRISADRRPENDNLFTNLNDPNVYQDANGTFKSKDNHMLLMRVEDATGKLLGGVIRFGVHGTVLAHEMFSEDVPGAIEYAAEKLWGAPLVMFLQGTAGDVTPAGGDHDRKALQRLEAVGVRAARAGAAAFATMSTVDHGVLATAFRWRNVNRMVLGYDDRSFGRAGEDGSFYPFRDGAILCGENGAKPPPDDGNPKTQLRDGHLGCIAIDDLSALLTDKGNHESPPQELSRAVLSAVRIGDWRFVTFPGEPVSQLGTLMLARAAKAGFGKKVAVMGYSQTHLFYLTSKADWFQGGYEAGMNIWGWKLGEWLAGQNVELLQRLNAYGSEPVWDGDPIEPLARENETVTSLPAIQRNPAWIGTDKAEVDRLSQISFAWRGGDPWWDRPVLSVLDSEGVVVSDSGGPGWAFFSDYTHSAPYRAVWEPGLEIREGTYTVQVEGRTAPGEPYRLYSPPFVVRTGALLSVTGTVGAAGISLYPGYVSHPETFDWLFAHQLPRYQVGGMRLINDRFGPSDVVPITTATLLADGFWLYPNAATATLLVIAWDVDCFCYQQPFATGAIGLRLPQGAVWVKGETNAKEVLLWK